MNKMTKGQPDRNLRELVSLLRRYRLEQDFTYREMAERIGINHSGLFNLLNDSNPRLNDRTRYRVEVFAQRVGLTERVAS